MNYPLIRRITAGIPRKGAAVVGWLLAAVLLAVCVSACGPGTAPQTMIIAATATGNEPAPGLSADVVQMLQSAGGASARATAYVVAPGTGQPTIIPLTPHRADGQVDFGPTRDQVLAANVAAVRRAVGREAAQGPFDLLNTMAAATRVASPPATLIVISSGLSTSGGLDMRQVGWDATSQSVTAQLKARGLLPNLSGYRVVFSGLADTSGTQPALPLPQRTSLIALWMAVCRASGATSCAVDDMIRPDPPSNSTIPVPVVQVPTVTSARGPGGTSVTLPDSLLFSLNSATLLPTANGVLQAIVEQARHQHLRVSITGHASPDGGTAAYNIALSNRRAIAVGNRLVSLGLPADQIVKVTGVGIAGESPSACLVQGQLDEAICGQMRRVVVLLSTP